VLAAEFMGRSIPSSGIGLVAVGFVVIFFLMSRNGGLGDSGAKGGGRTGRGRVHQCTRCGTNFQPEQVDVVGNGQVRTQYDDRCPNCGWDLDWGDADRPGGSSGTW